jgi:hypothetical protein
MRHSFVSSPLFILVAAIAACSVPPRVSSGVMSGTVGRTALVVAERVDVIDTLARETMVVEHPGGTLFVAGYGGPFAPTDSAKRRMYATFWRSRLWKSRDHGATWSRVDVGLKATGVIGNSDVALAVARDGTLYFVSMTFDAATNEGRRIAVGVSHDVGATWSWTVLSQHRFDDRPWVAVAPDGTAHVIWNDGSGVNHVMSHDRGARWTLPARVYERGGSSHLAVGPNGELAVRVAPASASGNKFDAGVDLIALSTDGGTSWRTAPAPGLRDWAPLGAKEKIPRWVEPIAWDGAGKLYSLWTDTAGVWLAQYNDRVSAWTSWRIVDCRDLCYFPYLVARGNGELAATWISGKGDSLHWHAAQIRLDHDVSAPRLTASAPLELDAWRRDPSTAGRLMHDTGGEYLAATFLRAGGIGVATVIQTPTRGGFTWWRLETH